MKVKVIEIFRDKYTNKVYKLNDEIEITEKRFKEINEKHNYVEKIIENKKIIRRKQTNSLLSSFNGG